MTQMKKIDYYSILLVEDEYYLRQAIKHIIEENDDSFKVVAEATNGEEAIDILKKESIQIVITDIQMPVMDGLTLSKHIKNAYPDIITIILTGYAEFDYVQEAIRQSVFDYLTKPVSEDNITTVLTRASIKLSKIYELPDEVGSSTNNPETIVNDAVSFIQENYMEDIDFGKISEEFGFSPAYLTKIFKKYTGMTPIKMLTEVRIHNAKNLLINTNLSVQEIGEKVGYPDQFHFSKTFRKVVDMNPSAYRNQHNQ